MSNRLLIDSTSLKVSAPGQDVYASGLNNLNFDSDFAYPEISESGIIHMTSTSLHTHYFSKTYSSLPLLMMSIHAIPEYGEINGKGVFSIVGESVTAIKNAPGSWYWIFRIYSDRFTFKMANFNDAYVYYKLFDLNLA